MQSCTLEKQKAHSIMPSRCQIYSGHDSSGTGSDKYLQCVHEEIKSNKVSRIFHNPHVEVLSGYNRYCQRGHEMACNLHFLRCID